MRRSWLANPLPWLAALACLYLIAPVIAFVVRLGGGVQGSPGLGPALLRSLATASISAALVTVLGTPLAYLLARRDGPASRALLALVALPLALPPLMSGILLLYLVGPLTPIGSFFGGGLTDSDVGIVLAQCFVAAPFLIVAARAAFGAVDPALEDVAAVLGHGRLARFARVAVPAALPGIAAGILLTWLRAFGEFGATVILAYHPFGLPVLTYVKFDESGLPGTMAPIAAALAAALIVLVLVQLRPPARLWRRRGTVASAPSAGSAPSVASAPSAASAPRVAPAGDRARPHRPVTLSFSLHKRLGSFSLSLEHTAQSPRLAVLGPSGAGKTLTLRLLAGLAGGASRASGEGANGKGASRVQVGDVDLTRVAAERRGIGYVPQQAALMPRRTVWTQVTFGVGADPALAAWWLARLGLAGLEGRYPEELSGGQQRRVSLVRALAMRPRVLLLDEPFSGLDAPVRDGLRRDLRRLQRETGLSTVIVTHDPEEAALLADEIIVLGEGRVLQAGERTDVLGAPASARVAALLGIRNTREGRVAGPDAIESGGAVINAPTGGLPRGTEVHWCIREERIALGEGGGYEASVIDEVDLGSARELTVVLGTALELTVRTSERAGRAGVADRAGSMGRADVEAPMRVRVRIDPSDISVWTVAAEPHGELVGTSGRDVAGAR